MNIMTMITGKANYRTCLLSHKKYPKGDLVRFVVINDTIHPEDNYQGSGRGYYVSKDSLKDTKLLKKPLRPLKRPLNNEEVEVLLRA